MPHRPTSPAKIPSAHAQIAGVAERVPRWIRRPALMQARSSERNVPKKSDRRATTFAGDDRASVPPRCRRRVAKTIRYWMTVNREENADERLVVNRMADDKRKLAPKGRPPCDRIAGRRNHRGDAD